MANSPTFMSGLTGFFGGDRSQQQQPGGNQDGGVDDDYVEEQPEPGVGDLIGEIFTPPDEEEEDEDLTPPGPVMGPDGKPLPTAQQKLAQTIQDAISKMGVTDDMIPADFDATNPKHLRDLIGKSNQATALTTIQLAFQPMQMAMEEMMTKFTQKMEAKFDGYGNQQSEAAILSGIVPEADDEKLSGLVQTLFKQAKQSKAGTGNPKVAAQMVRKGLDAMGIKSAKPADPMTGGFKSGKSALDAYAPLPEHKPNQQRRQNNGGGNGQ